MIFGDRPSDSKALGLRFGFRSGSEGGICRISALFRSPVSEDDATISRGYARGAVPGRPNRPIERIPIHASSRPIFALSSKTKAVVATAWVRASGGAGASAERAGSAETRDASSP